MNPGLIVKLRPTGPWRIGPDSGARNQVDAVYHSDSLYSAVTATLGQLGLVEEWLDATARSAVLQNGAPAVCFSSCFPFADEIGFIIPPRTIWPPSSPALLSARVRWKSARFVPLGIVEALLSGQTLDENQWAVDGASSCLVPVGVAGPFRTGLRFNAAVDRLTGSTERHSTACLEFRSGAGIWALVSFADDAAQGRWREPVETAIRMLADSGFGGERSRGWGRSAIPEFTEGVLPDMILRPRAPAAPPDNAVEQAPEEITPPDVPNGTGAQWLLSLFTPGAADAVDWNRGNYALLSRGGRVESAARSGDLKKQVQMIAEGSVLYAGATLRGSAPDVAPEGFAHPVFRAGFALSIPLPEVA